MRVILDTNVLMSGIFFGGIPGEILIAWRHGKLQLVISHAILDEYFKVANDLMVKYPTVNAIAAVKAIASISEMTLSVLLPDQICEDPDDDKFLSAALASKVSLIVSGDKLLNKVSGWSGIHVLSPRLFFDKYICKK